MLAVKGKWCIFSVKGSGSASWFPARTMTKEIQEIGWCQATKKNLKSDYL